jgi:hypothetical protein
MTYDESTLEQVSALSLTPNGQHGGIWMAGSGLAADAQGNVYSLMANGRFDTTLSDGFPEYGDYGNSFVKLGTGPRGLQVADYFTMFNAVSESLSDVDLGSGGILVLPDLRDDSGKTRHLAVGAGKDRNIYIVDRDYMGKFNPNSNEIYEEISSELSGGVFSTPAYFNGTLYYGAVRDYLKAFSITNALVDGSWSTESATTFPFPGTTPSISADGVSGGILWAIEARTIAPNNGIGVLHAYSASDLENEMYNSTQAGTRDQFADNKFITPMIANGKVFIGTPTGVAVFGLLKSPTPGAQ